MNEHEAGRELDALVAERVMGWTRVVRARETLWQSPKAGTWPIVASRLPHYSTDIAAAWQVVERMRADGWVCEVFGSDTANAEGYSVTLWRPDTSGSSVTQNATAPLAICRAALAAIDATTRRTA